MLLRSALSCPGLRLKAQGSPAVFSITTGHAPGRFASASGLVPSLGGSVQPRSQQLDVSTQAAASSTAGIGEDAPKPFAFTRWVTSLFLKLLLAAIVATAAMLYGPQLISLLPSEVTSPVEGVLHSPQVTHFWHASGLEQLVQALDLAHVRAAMVAAAASVNLTIHQALGVAFAAYMFLSTAAGSMLTLGDKNLPAPRRSISPPVPTPSPTAAETAEAAAAAIKAASRSISPSPAAPAKASAPPAAAPAAVPTPVAAAPKPTPAAAAVAAAKAAAPAPSAAPVKPAMPPPTVIPSFATTKPPYGEEEDGPRFNTSFEVPPPPTPASARKPTTPASPAPAAKPAAAAPPPKPAAPAPAPAKPAAPAPAPAAAKPAVPAQPAAAPTKPAAPAQPAAAPTKPAAPAQPAAAPAMPAAAPAKPAAKPAEPRSYPFWATPAPAAAGSNNNGVTSSDAPLMAAQPRRVFPDGAVLYSADQLAGDVEMPRSPSPSPTVSRGGRTRIGPETTPPVSTETSSAATGTTTAASGATSETPFPTRGGGGAARTPFGAPIESPKPATSTTAPAATTPAVSQGVPQRPSGGAGRGSPSPEPAAKAAMEASNNSSASNALQQQRGNRGREGSASPYFPPISFTPPPPPSVEKKASPVPKPETDSKKEKSSMKEPVVVAAAAAWAVLEQIQKLNGPSKSSGSK